MSTLIFFFVARRLQMKMDMQALAQAQFGEANKKFNAMKVIILPAIAPVAALILQ